MSAKITKKEGYRVEMEISVNKEQFEKGLVRAYEKTRQKYNVSGFRKGKAPRVMMERLYGEGVFYEEAIRILFPEAYREAVKETGIQPVDQPEIDIKELDRESGVVIIAAVDVKPEVILGEYKGVIIEKEEFSVTEEDVDLALAREADKNARTITVEHRPAQQNDIAIIDFEGFLDGVPFEGGKAQNHELKLGSGSFIPGFEDGILGRTPGESFEIKTVFPAEYHAEHLRGRETLFRITLHELKIREIPELDDEFAKDVSEFSTLAEYREDLKQKISGERESDAVTRMKNRTVDKVAEYATVDIPKGMIENRIDGLMEDMKLRLKYQGLSMEKYLEMIKSDTEQVREQYRGIAQSQVKARLVLEEVAKKEGFKATAEDVSGKIRELAGRYGMEEAKFLERATEEMTENIKDNIVLDKALDFLYALAGKK